MKNYIFLVTISVMALLCSETLAQSTWNPSDKTSGVTLSNGNLTAAAVLGGGEEGVRGTLSHSSGKYYFEVTDTLDTFGHSYIGVANSSSNLSSVPFGYGDSNGAGYYAANGVLYANTGSTSIAGSFYTTGNVISIAVDVTNHLIYWAKNGTWQNSANPGLGTGGADYITTSPVFPAYSLSALSSTVTLNTGATAFAYSIPSGFSAWGGAATSSSFIFTPTVIP
jgi:hypothetical protein